MAPAERQVLDAYVDGVNQGLGALRAQPFEYYVLRQAPRPWLAEDSFLVVLSMFVTLQESDGAYESTLATMRDVLPDSAFAFLAPAGTEWDSPVDGGPLPLAPIPDASTFDLRRTRAGRPTVLHAPRPIARAEPDAIAGDTAIGSNNWAVAAAHTRSGAALIANDMHLGIRVPNTWYRARLEWTDIDGAPRALVGVTLPGMPALVVGSNTQVAWGFTNTYADWSDIVVLNTDPSHPNAYRTPEGWRSFEVFDEVIDAAGGAPEHLSVRWTIWGPVLPADYRGRARAYRWTAHDAETLARTVTPLERAATIEAAMDEASTLGTPGQNMVVADRSGRIGWTVYGAMPRRVGLDGRLPVSWADGRARWDGWLSPAETPRLVDPPSGRIWTANARVVGGAMLQALGDGNWEVGSRARIIRDRLLKTDQVTADDMLAIQLDTSATFLESWRQLMLDTLDDAAVRGHPDRQAFRDVVANGWNGQADPASAAYRLTRQFRDLVSERVFSFVLADCYEADPTFDYSIIRRREGPLWALVTSRPTHLLDPAFATWEDLLRDVVDTLAAQLRGEGRDLRTRTWAELNITAYRHPLSAALPLVGRWLDMPQQALAGDLYTPQVHWGAIGASERLVVSPGREQEGILHMPTGQSGHPLSPFYRNSHEAWVEGRATPLMPGPTTHTLMLLPR
jgi:penicillin amidase